MSRPERSLGWVRAQLSHFGLSRVAVWIFVLVITAGTVTLVTDGADEFALFVAASALFLVWELGQRRLMVWGSVLGLVVFAVGFAFQWHLPLSLGIAIMLLSLPGLWGVLVGGAGVVAISATWFGSMNGDVALHGLLGLAQNVLLVYLLERTWASSRALEAVRQELAKTEVDAERTRLAGELNEVIGATLRQADLQTADIRSREEVADPRFGEHLAEITELVQHGLKQLDLLSAEPVLGDFDSELHTAQSLCKRLDVDFTAVIDEVDPTVSEMFPLLLRESVTNMFKHATPTRCTVVVRNEDGEAIFGFTNNGVAERDVPGEDGSGHRRWRRLLADLGGGLTAGPLHGGRYQVLARVPIGSTPAPSTSQERVSHG